MGIGPLALLPQSQSSSKAHHLIVSTCIAHTELNKSKLLNFLLAVAVFLNHYHCFYTGIKIYNYKHRLKNSYEDWTKTRLSQKRNYAV